jgi:hypothetical protein
LLITPCLRPSSSRHSCLFSHLFRVPIINSIPYSFHSQPSITSQPHFHIILNFAHTHSNSQLAQLHKFSACSIARMLSFSLFPDRISSYIPACASDAFVIAQILKFRLSLAAQLRSNQGIAHAVPWISAIAPPAAGQGVAGGRSHSASPHAPMGRAGYHFHLTFTNYRLQSPASSLSVHSATASHSQHTSQYRIHILSSNTGHIAVRSQHLSDVCVCRCCCRRC